MLGQTWDLRQPKDPFDKDYRLDADLVHLNIWDFKMTPDQVRGGGSGDIEERGREEEEWIRERDLDLEIEVIGKSKL